MKKNQSLAFAAAMLLAGTAGFTACSSDNEEVLSPNVVVSEDGTVGVKPEFVVSIPRSVVSRMSADVTQAAGNSSTFRGIDNIQLVPFTQEPAVGVEKSSNVIKLDAISSLRQAGSLNYKVYADEFVPVGTSHFLFYGKAIDNVAETAITEQADKFKFGVLNATNLGDDFTKPGAVEIALERINADKAAIATDDTGKKIIDKLNEIAAVSGWATSTNDVLKDLYAGFIKLQTAASEMVAVVLSDLYFSAAHVDYEDTEAYAVSLALRDVIKTVGTPVSKKPMVLNADYQGFPGNLGLPNGAARIAWNGTEFKDATAEYDSGFESNLTQYAYPAALWYYVSTPIKASDDVESPEYDAQNTWSEVISSVYGQAANAVADNTQSVALVKPAQYGVGRLEVVVKLGEEGKDKFYDHDGNEMDVTNGFTLKGILIGGQCGVGYDFTTKGNENLTIYDPEVTDNNVVTTTKNSTANQTLALETKKDLPVNIALELVNNGDKFVGKDGNIIPAGATFYLAAKLDPTAATNYTAGSLDKVFIQDHVTKVTVTIKNGKEGGSEDGPGEGGPTVPDLSSPTIELGTSVDLEWQEGLIFTPGI